MRILFVGALWRGSTSLQRMIALQELGHEVVGVDITPRNRRMQRWLPMRVLHRLGYPVDLAAVNQKILHYARVSHFDMLWIEKALAVTPATLKRFRALSRPASPRLVFYSPDDMMNPRNQSRYYISSLPCYDLHVTTKSYNVAELKDAGARDVFFVWKGYDPHTHRPVQLSPQEQQHWQTDVGFIGTFEHDRYQHMVALAQAGIPVVWRGSGRFFRTDRYPLLTIYTENIWDEEYVRAIHATKINLCFLRKVNRDLHTQRSVEIPACGRFMLAERTDEHLALFEAGREAAFFGDTSELIAQVRYYLQHEQERECIAAAGRQRCLDGGYSNHQRLTSVLEYLHNAGNEVRR